MICVIQTASISRSTGTEMRTAGETECLLFLKMHIMRKQEVSIRTALLNMLLSDTVTGSKETERRGVPNVVNQTRITRHSIAHIAERV